MGAQSTGKIKKGLEMIFEYFIFEKSWLLVAVFSHALSYIAKQINSILKYCVTLSSSYQTDKDTNRGCRRAWG